MYGHESITAIQEKKNPGLRKKKIKSERKTESLLADHKDPQRTLTAFHSLSSASAGPEIFLYGNAIGDGIIRGYPKARSRIIIMVKPASNPGMVLARFV